MKYVLLNKGDISSDYFLNSTHKPVEFNVASDSEDPQSAKILSGYYIVSVEDEFSPYFIGYIKFTSDELSGLQDDIRNGVPIVTRLAPQIGEVKTQKEKGEITTKMARGVCTLDANGSGVISITVPSGGRQVSGGSAWFDHEFNAESIVSSVQIHHPQAGAVGYYSDDDMDDANEGWWTEPDGVVRVQSMDFFGSIPEGFIIKIYMTHGAGAAASGTKARINIQWGKKN